MEQYDLLMRALRMVGWQLDASAAELAIRVLQHVTAHGDKTTLADIVRIEMEVKTQFAPTPAEPFTTK